MSSCYTRKTTLLRKGCRGKDPAFKGHTLADLVQHYITHILPNHPGKQVRKPTFDQCFSAAMERRWFGETCIDSHQRRLYKKYSVPFFDSLKEIKSKIKEGNNFKAVYDSVNIDTHPGIGRLTIYDTALRICLCRGMAPEQVYLHNGAFKGAKNLLGKGFLKIKKIRDNTPYDLNVFPQELQKLAAWEIENFLCCCKQEIKSIEANA